MCRESRERQVRNLTDILECGAVAPLLFRKSPEPADLSRAPAAEWKGGAAAPQSKSAGT